VCSCQRAEPGSPLGLSNTFDVAVRKSKAGGDPDAGDVRYDPR